MIAGLADYARPADKLSTSQSAALALTGLICLFTLGLFSLHSACAVILLSPFVCIFTYLSLRKDTGSEHEWI